MLILIISVGIFIIVLSIIAGLSLLAKASFIPKEKGVASKGNLQNVSVIIPARNEALRIKPLLQSLSSQNEKPLEMIVVDDESSDETASIAKSYGCKVVSVDQALTDWKGKSAACWQGATAAKGSWLLFLDADTELIHKNSLTDYTSHFSKVGATGILSVQPYHKIKKLYENLSVIFNIIVLAGMNSFSLLAKKDQAAGAFGPCILCTRTEYFQTGGHEAVGEAIMDDIVLGEVFKKAGYPVRLRLGKGFIQFRMYSEGIQSLLEGWTKGFATASKSTQSTIMFSISMWITGAFLLPALALSLFLLENVTLWLFIFVALYVAYYGVLLYLSRLAGNFSPILLMFYPLFFFFFTFLFIRSSYLTKIKKRVQWRGRKVNV
ncbi:glycosyltransferase [Alkalihalobacillus trypoxylicola]|uniref:4,4'-diaponeurosporenoate glycosyltransferase n=1 Tax=Alkalihalobacillus trypoxylicola TaxID=519424 RepID=A0A161PF15_9BACI|nr:glycosyltransferase [Alkalihalobacillus trypoxylicola]KYG26980.1 hypothetical protein AZF04_11625 [Alkalihalobacillus trypoxylicola]